MKEFGFPGLTKRNRLLSPPLRSWGFREGVPDQRTSEPFVPTDILTDWTYFDLLLLRIRQGRRDDDRNHQECDESKYAVVGTAEDVFQPSHQKRTEEAAQVAQSVDRATCSTGHRGGEEERRDCPKHGSRGLQEGTRQDQAGEREPVLFSSLTTFHGINPSFSRLGVAVI